MSYTIDNSNIENNILTLTDKNDLKYFIKLVEICEDSDVWTLSFIQEPNKISSNSFEYMFILCKEIFESDLLDKNKVSKILLLIEGDSRENADEKTEIFTKLINDDWDVKIEQDPETIVEGGLSYINYNKNFIYITKKEKVLKNITKKEKVLENIVVVGIMKFCPNCGLKNNNYKFCPSCGQNLQQA
jgi:hypothetical protein